MKEPGQGIDYYQELEVPNTASTTEIKRAYRRFVRKLRPDIDPASAEQFYKVSEAYQVLSDEQRRQQYDERSGQLDQKIIASVFNQAETLAKSGVIKPVLEGDKAQKEKYLFQGQHTTDDGTTDSYRLQYVKYAYPAKGHPDKQVMSDHIDIVKVGTSDVVSIMRNLGEFAFDNFSVSSGGSNNSTPIHLQGLSGEHLYTTASSISKIKQLEGVIKSLKPDQTALEHIRKIGQFP